MPSPHPTQAPERPTRRQLAYLRSLAQSRGQTFSYPTTKRQASQEIRRLLGVPADSSRDHRIETHRLATTPTPGDATRVRADETTGYGAHAHWTHHREQRS